MIKLSFETFLHSCRLTIRSNVQIKLRSRVLKHLNILEKKFKQPILEVNLYGQQSPGGKIKSMTEPGRRVAINKWLVKFIGVHKMLA